MGFIFNLNSNREIYAATQNCFSYPSKHPTRILDEHVISYVLEGEWSLDVGSESIVARKDNVFIMPAKILHSGTAPCPKNTKTMYVHFSVLQQDRPGLFSQIDKNEIYTDFLIDTKNRPEIKELFISIINEKAKGCSLKAAVLLNLFMCKLSEKHIYDKSKYAVSNAIKQIVRENMHRNISNKEIAEILNIGIRTTETDFKACCGITVHQYILQEKISESKFLLEYYPQQKIVQIAEALGFYDEYHFSRQFKTLVGVSPTEYRKNALKKYTISE